MFGTCCNGGAHAGRRLHTSAEGSGNRERTTTLALLVLTIICAKRIRCSGHLRRRANEYRNPSDNRACLQPPAGLLAGPWSVICSRLPQLYKLLAFIKRQTMSPTNALSCMSLMSVMAPSRQAIITLLCVFGSLMLANCGPEHHREFARIDDSEACCLSLVAAAVVGLGTQGPKCPRDPMGLCTESCPYLPACNLDE